MVIDFGALVDGYRSDMTRTVAGRRARRHPAAACSRSWPRPRPPAWPRCAAGVERQAVDEACRAIIAGRRLGRRLHPRHRPRRRPRHPRGARGSTVRLGDTLAVGHVVTVEPGVYLPEHGGVRIEDTVVVTADGCRPLTQAPKDPPLAARSRARSRADARDHHQRPEERHDPRLLDDGLFQVVDFQHVKPGKGGAFVRTTLQERAHRGACSTAPSAPARRSSRP